MQVHRPNLSINTLMLRSSEKVVRPLIVALTGYLNAETI